jgi:hypothetical protein
LFQDPADPEILFDDNRIQPPLGGGLREEVAARFGRDA